MSEAKGTSIGQWEDYLGQFDSAELSPVLTPSQFMDDVAILTRPVYIRTALEYDHTLLPWLRTPSPEQPQARTESPSNPRTEETETAPSQRDETEQTSKRSGTDEWITPRCVA